VQLLDSERQAPPRCYFALYNPGQVETDLDPSSLWLGRYRDRQPIRGHGALRLYRAVDGRSGEQRGVLVGRQGCELELVRGALQELKAWQRRRRRLLLPECRENLLAPVGDLQMAGEIAFAEVQVPLLHDLRGVIAEVRRGQLTVDLSDLDIQLSQGLAALHERGLCWGGDGGESWLLDLDGRLWLLDGGELDEPAADQARHVKLQRDLSRARPAVLPALEPGDRAEDGPQAGHGERYVIFESLGEGSHGTVYRAQDLQLGQTVAIKRLSAGHDARVRARLLRELRLMRSVVHSQLARGFELYEEVGQLGAVMEYLPGENLAVAAARGESLDTLRLRLAELSEGLAALHGAGVAHRDLKPENVVLHAGRGAVLVDFGQVSDSGEGDALTRTGEPFGESTYRAPEHLEGGGSIAGDCYALGQMVAGLLGALSEGYQDLLTRAASDKSQGRPSAAEWAAALREGPAAPRVEVFRNGLGFRVQGEPVDLKRRAALAQILARLVQALQDEPGVALQRETLQQAGWPGENIRTDSAANRVYVALSELRKLGLGASLQRTSGGYLLDPAQVQVVEP